MGGGVIGWRTAGCGRCSGPRRSCAPAPAGGGVPNRSRSGSPPRRCGGMFSRPPAPELGLSPSLRGGGWPCSRGGGEGREAGGAVAAGAPAGLVVAPGLAPGLGLPRSNGAASAFSARAIGARNLPHAARASALFFRDSCQPAPISALEPVTAPLGRSGAISRRRRHLVVRDCRTFFFRPV